MTDKPDGSGGAGVRGRDARLWCFSSRVASVTVVGILALRIGTAKADRDFRTGNGRRRNNWQRTVLNRAASSTQHAPATRSRSAVDAKSGPRTTKCETNPGVAEHDRREYGS